LYIWSLGTAGARGASRAAQFPRGSIFFRFEGFPAFDGLSASSQLPQRLRKRLILLRTGRMKFPHFAAAQRRVIPRKRTSEQTEGRWDARFRRNDRAKDQV